MLDFKTLIEEDNANIFMNTQEFADLHTIEYAGRTYTDIPALLDDLTEKDRKQLAADHAQGLYMVTAELYCMAKDLDNRLPKKGSRIAINDKTGSDYYREFYVASVKCDMGMLELGLEATEA